MATNIIKTVTDMNAWNLTDMNAWNLDMFGSGCYNTDVVRREIKAWINHTNTGTAMKFDDINDVSGAREQFLYNYYGSHSYYSSSTCDYVVFAGACTLCACTL